MYGGSASAGEPERDDSGSAPWQPLDRTTARAANGPQTRRSSILTLYPTPADATHQSRLNRWGGSEYHPRQGGISRYVQFSGS
jgi:hypothetical protein